MPACRLFSDIFIGKSAFDEVTTAFCGAANNRHTLALFHLDVALLTKRTFKVCDATGLHGFQDILPIDDVVLAHTDLPNCPGPATAYECL